jgi:quercetin dioxygenase-like cupin family protein
MTDIEPAMTVVQDLAEKVEIQPASTISSTVLTGQGARVVLFGFDTDEELSEHTAAMPVLLQVLSGSLEISAAGSTSTLPPGDLIHLTERTPHSVLATEPTILMLTMLDPRAKQK